MLKISGVRFYATAAFVGPSAFFGFLFLSTFFLKYLLLLFIIGIGINFYSCTGINYFERSNDTITDNSSSSSVTGYRFSEEKRSTGHRFPCY